MVKIMVMIKKKWIVVTVTEIPYGETWQNIENRGKHLWEIWAARCSEGHKLHCVHFLSNSQKRLHENSSDQHQLVCRTIHKILEWCFQAKTITVNLEVYWMKFILCLVCYADNYSKAYNLILYQYQKSDINTRFERYTTKDRLELISIFLHFSENENTFQSSPKLYL